MHINLFPYQINEYMNIIHWTISGLKQNIQQLWLVPHIEKLDNNKEQLTQYLINVLQWAADMEYYLGMDHYLEYDCRTWPIWRQPYLSKDMVSEGIVQG